MKKINIISIILFSILLGCSSTNVISKDLTGQDIKQRYNSLQSFTYSFENEEQDGAITETQVNVYMIGNKSCAIVGRTFGDSGFGGSETLILFKNKNLISAILRPFAIVGLKDNGVKNTKPNEVSYEPSFPNKEVILLLDKDFKNYLKQMNKKTLRQCK